MFQTESPYTLMISGTGHAGMEAAIANLLEPGEKIVVGVNGIWGERVADLAERYQGECLGVDCGRVSKSSSSSSSTGNDNGSRGMKDMFLT
jgi:aspartate aminotransferase-like enzyme